MGVCLCVYTYVSMCMWGFMRVLFVIGLKCFVEFRRIWLVVVKIFYNSDDDVILYFLFLKYFINGN